MRVLFVTPYPPSPIRVRAYGFVRQLARHHHVTVLAPVANEREWTDAAALRRHGIAVRVVPERAGARALRALRAVASTTPLQVAFGAAPALRRAIATELATGGHDVLHVEHLRALGSLPPRLDLPLVWDAVDCVSHLFEQRAAASAPALRPLVRLEARRTRAYEWRQLRALRQVMVTCERDRQLLLAYKPAGSWDDAPDHLAGSTDRADIMHIADIAVVANGVEQREIGAEDEPRHPATLVFSGKMSYHANLAGLALLVRAILPRIWARRPDVRLVIAGSNPPRAVRQLARDPRIVVTGYVSDLRPYIARARVAVSPLPYAVGVQNKILEAMALGTPVVTSSVAASGLRAVPGRDLLVADAPADFAAEVLRLLDDDTQWRALAMQGLAYVRAQHSWEAIGSQLASVYEHALADRKRVAGQPVFAAKGES